MLIMSSKQTDATVDRCDAVVNGANGELLLFLGGLHLDVVPDGTEVLLLKSSPRHLRNVRVRLSKSGSSALW